MTARQIIEEIQALPAEEQREIKAFLSDQEQSTSVIKFADQDKAMSVADKIFTERAELFQKLAQ